MVTLYKHQKEALPALEHIEKLGRGGILADQMGLGKTLTMAIHIIGNKFEGKTDLIVATCSLMSNWVFELERASDYLGVDKPSILIFHGKNRIGKLESQDWDVVITTYSIIGTGELNKRSWGRTVLDESHNIKNGFASKPSRCAVAAFEIGSKSKKNWCISGTPFNNRMSDLASQCRFIGTAPYNDFGWWKTCAKEAEEGLSIAVEEWRKKFVIRRTKDALMKPPTYHEVDVKPTEFESTKVDALRTQAAEQFEEWNAAEGGDKISLQGKILGLIQRLRIVSNSYYCDRDYEEIEQVTDHCAKVDKIINMLDDKVYSDPKKGVVVFSQFTSFLSLLENVIEEQLIGIDLYKFTGDMDAAARDNVVKKFNTSREPRIILVSLMAGGVGISLHEGSSTVFICEPYYNPFIEQQAEERVHRLGQQHDVNVYRFNMNNSVETWINELKKKKMYLASGLELVKPTDAVMTFNFKDLSRIFRDNVAFDQEEKEDDPKPVSRLPRKIKKAVVPMAKGKKKTKK